MSRLGMLMAALVMVLGASSCSGGVSGPVVEGSQRMGGASAEVFGTVVIEGNCMYLAWTEPVTRYPVVWPHGTRWDPGKGAVVLPDGTHVLEGDWVYGGGGYHYASGIGQFTNDEGFDLVNGCVDNEYGEAAVFNSSADIDVARREARASSWSRRATQLSSCQHGTRAPHQESVIYA